MYDFQLTVGLFDAKSKKQEIATAFARNIIVETLMENDIVNFTLIDCIGCYKHDDGTIVQEPSIRIEIAHDDDVTEILHNVIADLKKSINQECIMFKKIVRSDISFL